MGFTDNYLKLRKERMGVGNEKNTSFDEEYANIKAQYFDEEEEEDIAPVREDTKTEKEQKTDEEKEKDERKWFQKGAFEDGYQFGDITKTIYATDADLANDVTAGILGIGEKVVDTGATIVGGVAGLFGNDKVKDKMADFAKKDLYDEHKVAEKINSMNPTALVRKLLGVDVERDSVFSKKTDDLAYSGGQLVGTVGLQSVGVPWYVTTGATSFGGAMEGALREGATFEEAAASSAISAGAEILSEKLFGGSGLGEKGLINLEPLTRGISNKLVKALADYGVDIAAEGFEEIFSQFAGNFASSLYKEDDLEDLLFSEEAIDGYIESFIGGGVLGGGMNVGNVTSSIQSGKDYRSGLTANEETVVNKVYEDRIAEAKENGETLTAKDKDKIYDEVLSDLENGYISTDNIESILGGEDYSNYKKELDHQEAIKKELDELRNMKSSEMTDVQIERMAELKAMKPNTEMMNTLKFAVDEKISSAVSGTRLSESYNERSRKGQAFEADLNQYDEKQREIVKKAIESGILNNSNRTHQFVDIVAKISADKGVSFDFVNNAKLKESGFALDGKVVNGFVTKDGISINIDSPKAWQSTVGHEITHVLEGTELYTELQNSLFEYAETKGDLKGRRDALAALYDGVKGADVDAELTADLVGDYLFSDSDFINNLSTQHRNVFQKVYDEIKYLCRVATAGSKEARQLEKVRHAFEKAYRESGEASGDTKYSISEGYNAERDGAAVNEFGTTTNFDQAGFVLSDGRMLKLSQYGQSGVQHKLIERVYDDVKGDAAIDRFIQEGHVRVKASSPGIEIGSGVAPSTNQLNAISRFVSSSLRKNGVFYLDITGENGEDVASVTYTEGQSASDVIFDIKDYFERGKVPGDVRYSLSDSDGKQLTKEQQDYFKDSKVRDENGNLKVMYHGSQDAGFHVFDPSMSDDDTSLFFVDRNDVAASYSGTTETYEAQTIRTAEDMNKFIESIGVEGYEVVEKDGKFTLLYEGDRVADSNTAQGIYSEFCWYEGVGEGDANYKVYLNLTNPLEVDAKGRPWNKIDAEFSQEVYDKYKSLTAEEKDALIDLAEWEDFRLFNSEIQEARDNELASAYAKMGEDVNIYDLFSVAADSFSEEAMRENARRYLKTRDFAQRAKEQGYDGVIFKNLVDNGGYSNGSEGASTVAIAFDSNQIKSVANEKPTGDPDIRFSLSGAVEETKDLMALHNLHTDEVLKQLEMGGIPYPSVAVTKPDLISHEGFGEVTLILPKETIDPKTSKYNKIYSADAYTPTFPKISYEASMDVADRISNKVIELYERVPEYYRRSLASLRDYTNINERLNSNRGERGMITDYSYDYGLKQLYLADIGEAVPVVTSRTEKQMTDTQKEQYQSIVDRLGTDAVNSLADKGWHRTVADARRAWLEEHGEALKDAYAEYWSGDGLVTKAEALEIANGESDLYWFRELRQLLEYAQTGGTTIEVKEDYNATDVKIDEKIDESAYKKWLGELFGGIEGRSGLRNDKDMFTPSGNRRSFSQLHDPITIDNVIKAMRKKEQKGEGAFGTSNINGASARQYGSISEVKADSSRLGKMEQAEHDAIQREITDRLYDIAIRYANGKDTIDAKNTLVEAVAKYESKEDIARYLKQFDYVYKHTDDIVNDLIELRDYIRTLSTPYFEAKPRRAVGFDEVGVFVIPRNADVKLKQELLNRGYSIAEYDPDVEGDRQKVVNSFEEYKFSLSDVNETPKRYGSFATPARDLRYEAPVQENVAPVQDAVQDVQDGVQNVAESDMFPDDLAPVNYDSLTEELEAVEAKMYEISKQGETEENINAFRELVNRYHELQDMIEEQRGHINGLTDADAPPEMEAPFYGEGEAVTVDDPFEGRDIKEVGNRKVKAYMFENPEVKPFFQSEANIMLGELRNSTKGERFPIIDQFDGYIRGYSGVQRRTSQDIAYLLDECGYTYDEIEKGLRAIIEDNGAENNACSKRIEFLLNDRLLKGNVDFETGMELPPNQEYIDLLNEKQITEYNEESFKRFMETADQFAPPVEEDIGPVVKAAPVSKTSEGIAPPPSYQTTRGGKGGVPEGQRTFWSDEKTAEVYDVEPETAKKKNRALSKFKTNFVDKGSVFEDLSLKTKNRELMGKYNYMLYSEGRAQHLMGEGTSGVKALNDIREVVESSGKAKQFYEYMYHMHNIDRMSLNDKAMAEAAEILKSLPDFSAESLEAIAKKKITDKTPEADAELIQKAREYVRLMESKNKPVFGNSVTADVSRDAVARLVKENPEFEAYAEDVYTYLNHLRSTMVESGVISQETADLWAEMYPHYVPVRRLGDEGLNVDVPLFTGRTGVNAPVKRATGGNRDILPLFDTIALRTEQTFKANAKNRFGVELMNTLGTTIERTETNIDEAIDSVDQQDGLLQEGKDGRNPTFTVFENGERVTFEITEDMYDALKPTSDGLLYRNKLARGISNAHRGLLTEYNPVFMFNNAIKDAQDVLINSQHPVRTYMRLPKAVKELATKGRWYTEYMENGGEQNTYFDGQTKTFKAQDNAFKRAIGMPLRAMSVANNFVERMPRLAEYIASREAGQSIEVAMLDSARVTTNFAAGGDVTKFLNGNGATFLNASVQGAAQQIRNVREAKSKGLEGWVSLAARTIAAGLPAILLNGLLWDDDEDYEELSDYVKQNYYVVAKYGDGQFVRIPKGRTLAVIQDAFEQMGNLVTGNDEVDMRSFVELAISNLAPNNPIENNILAPIIQAANNETWYGDDLVPTRLQDLPSDEQFDESTDSISKWLGENFDPFDLGPYKINYLLNQYSGGVGDVVLPMLTPEAERGDDSLLGNMIAPFKDKFSTDSVMKNQNVSDFYDTVDELTTNAKSSKATDEDILMYKYMNTVNAELGELYKEKREIQNSDLANDEKYAAVRDVQDRINAIARESLETYGDVHIDNGYASIGDRHFRLNDDGEWQKITDDQFEKQEEVTSGLGISPSEYWNDKAEYDFAYDYPEKYAFFRENGITYDDYASADEDGKRAYSWAAENPEKYTLSKAVTGDLFEYRKYTGDLYDIKADKDEDGKAISGSAKEKKRDYIFGLDLDYGQKVILYRSLYDSQEDRNTYNADIVQYLDSREDISYEEMKTILEELGMKMDANGWVTWD